MNSQPVPSKSLKRLLAPFAAFCIRRSIKLQTVLEALKEVFLEAAEKQLIEQGSEVSANRLSLMTGVHRKDISRISQQTPEQTKTADIVTRIIGQWQTDSRFKTSKGQPRTLHFEKQGSKFSDLVASVSREVSPYSVLFELERTGSVERTSRGIKLKKQSYSAKGDIEQGLRFLGEDTDDLILSVEENIFSDPSVPNLHLKTEYDNIPQHLEPKIRKWCKEEGLRFHKRVRDYLSRHDRGVASKGSSKSGSLRVAVGTFSITASKKPALNAKKEKK